MPLISRIGARSFKVRLVYGTIYAVLVLGAVSMIYPLLLMLAGSVKSDTDVTNIGPWPRYWRDDVVLFQKYVESKYNMDIAVAEAAWGRPVGSWRLVEPPGEKNVARLDAFLAWRDQCPWWWLGGSHGRKLVPTNGRLFVQQLHERFDGDIEALGRELASPHGSWHNVRPPAKPGYRFPHPDRPFVRAFLEFARTRPLRDRIIENPDGLFRQKHLVPTYTDDIGRYNEACGTSHGSYDEIYLAARAPREQRPREDWELFVRDALPITFIRLDAGLDDRFRRFIENRYPTVASYNETHSHARIDSFDQVVLPRRMPPQRIDQTDFVDFIRDRKACPLESIEVYGPRQAFERFVAEQGVGGVATDGPIPLPVVAADWHDCMAATSEIRWDFTTRNYKHVLDYILLHGRGISNTIIYCVLAVGLALVVNPVAAYALSRFKPPSTYTVLLFCIATMAFPGEVTMIPSFLLLKQFPLWPLAGGLAAFGLVVWVLARIGGASPRLPEISVALAVGIVVGVWVVPTVTGRPYVSLLNTFAALVLPGVANGYMIFLLKGFFDSIPRQLYEAADIDGASEWTKFWGMTMSLSTPILAVMALGAFTGAYSAFMMALVVIPDEDMWTIMVWLFQLQHVSHQSVVYASLVIAAIPTFLMFVFCQGIIMKGIVVPVDK